jgi:3-keto-disaccharide hydrolase
MVAWLAENNSHAKKELLKMAASVLILIAIAQVVGARPSVVVSNKPTALFNGQNLAGWTYHLEKPDAKPADVWSVKDGTIHCTGKPAGYLVTKETNFENYVLSLDWRWPDKGGNNGVLVHVTNPEQLGVWPKSFEVQLQSGDAGELWVIGTTLQVQHPNTHIEDRRHKNDIRGAEKPLGHWNTMEITCVDDEIDVKVNGYLVNSATKLSQHRGAIALQSEGTSIEFRGITLAKLPPNAGLLRRQQRQRQLQFQKEDERRRQFQMQQRQRGNPTQRPVR